MLAHQQRAVQDVAKATRQTRHCLCGSIVQKMMAMYVKTRLRSYVHGAIAAPAPAPIDPRFQMCAHVIADPLLGQKFLRRAETRPIDDERAKKRGEDREGQKSRGMPSPSRTKHVAPATGNLLARNDAEGGHRPRLQAHGAYGITCPCCILLDLDERHHHVPVRPPPAGGIQSKARELACCIGHPVAAAPRRLLRRPAGGLSAPCMLT